MRYFETITNTSIFNMKRRASLQDINNITNLPAGSDWSTEQLFAARVLVRTARPDDRCNHVLPALREHFDETARDHAGICELLKGPNQAGYTLTETELVHLYGPSLGPVWAALARFGNVVDLKEPEIQACAVYPLNMMPHHPNHRPI
ncbi:hypothetical protein QBC46DRAFT_337951 [Diplogelasinospora grovesii]|uniref:Uncharacterized protein n=1 Tax=Diplogelasinospora grovesii TaxID=303347 RepID=A0AAN6NFL1_9PEZI|nr:hypothetical protein QBC46DRAFT_337951 [Diplogelasinospora grovesii]